MSHFKRTFVSRKAPNTVTFENSPFRDHFEFVADCVLLEHESRPQFFKIVAAMIDEYQPATFTESLQIATMASARWRQFRYAAMSAAVAATDWTDRARLLELLARWERHCKRSYNSNRKFLLEILSRRVNSVGGPTPSRPAPVATQKSSAHRQSPSGATGKKRKATRSAATADSVVECGKLLTFPAPKPPIAA